jgi:hypothetical protein
MQISLNPASAETRHSTDDDGDVWNRWDRPKTAQRRTSKLRGKRFALGSRFPILVDNAGYLIPVSVVWFASNFVGQVLQSTTAEWIFFVAAGTPTAVAWGYLWHQKVVLSVDRLSVKPDLISGWRVVLYSEVEGVVVVPGRHPVLQIVLRGGQTIDVVRLVRSSLRIGFADLQRELSIRVAECAETTDASVAGKA